MGAYEMSEEIKKWDFPVKTSSGYLVRLYFKTMPGALSFLESIRALGNNSAVEALESWRDESHKAIDKEARSLKKKVLSWLRR